MASYTPASNVQAAAAAAFIAPIILHICAANNIVIPPDAADALPGLLAVVVAYGWDCLTEGNKPSVK